jgi:hypothetical protein
MKRRICVGLSLILIAGLAAMSGCHYGTYGFSYQSGYPFCEPSYHDYGHHHHGHSWSHCD